MEALKEKAEKKQPKKGANSEEKEFMEGLMKSSHYDSD